ncbi:MAG TPA: glycyl-radical enzyme activating protein [Clostridia bacterium]|nr:glycyl-radical enzyme activating protein [Clostridia bacterium]
MEIDAKGGLTTGLVLDIDRFSTHDGPGIRMVVFMKGCPLRCKWCHSPESQANGPDLLYQQSRCRACLHCVSACPEGAISPLEDGTGIRIDRNRCVRCFACAESCHPHALRVAGTLRTVDEIAEIARRDRFFYAESGGGVTVSGGEPLMQAPFVLALMRALRAIPVHTALETAGCGDLDALLAIARHTDLIYYDVKLLDSARHRYHTGLFNELILSNLRALAAEADIRDRICVRTPCIPGVNDAPEDIRAIAAWVRGLGIAHMEVMPYNAMADAKYEWIGRPYPMGTVEEPAPEHIKRLQAILKDEGLRAP